VDQAHDVKRVLLVDDEPAVFPLVRRVVERAHPGAVVVYASDLASAEWQLRSTAVRLVLTDMSLVGDGEGGLKVVALATELGIPVAVITAGQAPALQEVRQRGVAIIKKEDMSSGELARLVADAFAT
jgi:DNA-binding NtrC family response regulator